MGIILDIQIFKADMFMFFILTWQVFYPHLASCRMGQHLTALAKVTLTYKFLFDCLSVNSKINLGKVLKRSSFHKLVWTNCGDENQS